jgi:two-component system sensor histidine kinase SenX3
VSRLFSILSRRWQTFSLSIWIVGLIALFWGLFSLHNIFSQERDDAVSEILSRHKTLEQYAFQAFNQSLQQQLALANVNLRHVLRDPLKSNNTILYFEDSRQLLPRPSVYRNDDTQFNNAENLYQELLAVEPVDLVAESLSPWNERRILLSNFKLAVESNDAGEIRWAFREISEQRARTQLQGNLDIPYMMAVLEYLVTFSNPEKTLVQNVIRNGSIVDQEMGNYGLQRSLIAQRDLFSKQEFEYLRDMIVSMSKKFDIPYEDFLQQSRVENQVVPVNFAAVKSPVFILDNHWYVERRADEKILGVAVDIESIITNIDMTMKAIGLLESGDIVQNALLPAQVMPLSEVQLAVKSNSLQVKLQSVEKRFWIKTVLLFASAVLVVSIAVLVTFIQFRKQRYLALKSDFIATVSHELKTPLASVRLLSETLLRKTQYQASAKDYPLRIINTVDSMSLLVDNILSFNRLTKGAWPLKKSPVYLEEIVSSLKKEFSQYTQLPLHIEIENLEDVEINADQELIKILFRNLVNNACKYNEQDKVNIAIKGESDPQFTVYVKDNGIGIKKRNWATVFQEFSRIVESKEKSISGTGLGLAICKKIMQLHDGDIDIAGSNEYGTTFRLRFEAT